MIDLSNGRFQWPRSEAELRLLDPQSFRWLMEGLSIEQPKAIRKGPTKSAVLRHILQKTLSFFCAFHLSFGQSSEKKKFVLPDAEQLRIFNEAEQLQDAKAEEPTEKTFTVRAHERKAKRTADELVEDLPVKEVLLDIPEQDRVCGKCGAPLKQIGKKFVRRELEVIPRQVSVTEYYVATYACEECEKKTGYAGIYSMKPPVSLIRHSLASPSTVANVMMMKG